MSQKLKAIYKDGTFIPKANCSLPNNTDVELSVYRDRSIDNDIIDPDVRKEVLNSLLRRMKQVKNN